MKNENGDYVLNGSKCFITNGTVASTIVVFAMTDQKALSNHGISAFIVESSFPGFRGQEGEEEDGYPWLLHLRPDLRGLCRAQGEPAGQAGQGIRHRHEDLDGGRIGIAAQALAWARRH